MSALTDRLDEWEALAEKASEGPWHPGRGRTHRYVMGPVYSIAETGVVDGMPDESVAAIERDAAFIAASRTALPTLVEALRAVLASCDNTRSVRWEPSTRRPVRVVDVQDLLRDLASALGVEP